MVYAPRVVELESFYVIGIARRTSNQSEADPAVAEIPGLWQRFFDEGISRQVAGRVSTKVRFGVYTEYETDETGQFTVIAGVEASSLQNVPEGMIGVKVPAARYLVFDANGELPSAIINAWREIWAYFEDNSSYTRTYQSDFEIYDVSKKEHAEIYISIH